VRIFANLFSHLKKYKSAILKINVVHPMFVFSLWSRLPCFYTWELEYCRFLDLRWYSSYLRSLFPVILSSLYVESPWANFWNPGTIETRFAWDMFSVIWSSFITYLIMWPERCSSNKLFSIMNALILMLVYSRKKPVTQSIDTYHKITNYFLPYI
jgi:hypothetical protein